MKENNFFKEDIQEPVDEIDEELKRLQIRLNKIHFEIICTRIKRILIQKEMSLKKEKGLLLAMKIHNDFKDVTVMKYDDDEFFRIMSSYMQHINQSINSIN